MSNFISTDFIVLKKYPYMESSLIVYGLSPDYGKMDFLFRGAKKISKRIFPEIDYFRTFTVNYKDKNKNLIVPESMEMQKEHDQLAFFPEKLMQAFQIVPFILKNTRYGVSCRLLYKALLRYLNCLIKGENYRQFFIKLVYFYENGLLGEISTDGSEKNKKFLALLIKHATEDYSLPEIKENYYIELEKYLDALCVKEL